MYRLQFGPCTCVKLVGPHRSKNFNKYGVRLLQDALNRDQRCWESRIDVGRKYKFVAFHSLQCNDNATRYHRFVTDNIIKWDCRWLYKKIWTIHIAQSVYLSVLPELPHKYSEVEIYSTPTEHLNGPKLQAQILLHWCALVPSLQHTALNWISLFVERMPWSLSFGNFSGCLT